MDWSSPATLRIQELGAASRKRAFDENGEPIPLCPNCGWNTKDHCISPYHGCVRVIYTSGDRAIWELGPEWLLKDEPTKEAGKDLVSVEYLRRHTTIPLVPEMSSFQSGSRLLVLSRRVKGCPLADIIDSLTPDERKVYAEEVVKHIIKLRTITSNTMESVDGKLLRDWSVTQGLSPRQYNHIGRTEDEWWDKVLAPGLSGCPQETVDKLRQNFPACAPYTFTHGDLGAQNIIVNNGHVAAIIDWEFAGFYPAWEESRALERIQNPNWLGPLLRAFQDQNLPFVSDDLLMPYVWNFREIWQEQNPHVPTNLFTSYEQPFCECRPFFRQNLEQLSAEEEERRHDAIAEARSQQRKWEFLEHPRQPIQRRHSILV